MQLCYRTINMRNATAKWDSTILLKFAMQAEHCKYIGSNNYNSTASPFSHHSFTKESTVQCSGCSHHLQGAIHPTRHNQLVVI